MTGLVDRTALLTGLACMALGMLLIPVGDAIAKHLSGTSPYSPGFLAWSRFAIGLCLVLPVALFQVRFCHVLSHRFLFQQSVRATLIAGTITLIITAVGKAPLADAFGAFFIGPIVAVVFAVVLLKERATALEWGSVLVGFAGVLLVVQPSGQMNFGLLYALASGFCYAGFLVATRWSAGNGSPVAQLTAQLALGALLLSPLAFGDLRDHGLQQIELLGAMGLSSVSSNLLSLLALARAGAAWLAPVVYVQIISATTIGVLWFGEPVAPVAAVGLMLILCTGLLRVPWRTLRLRKAAAL